MIITEVDFFNTYLLRRGNYEIPTGGNVGTGESFDAIGFPITPGVAFPGNLKQAVYTDPTGGNYSDNSIKLGEWYVEESRIRGGFNNVATDLGVKAYLNEERVNQQHRFNSLIYSGVYNSRTGINDTNVFSVADDLVRSADPQNGSIQITLAEDTNLIVWQQNKVSRALIDKDTIYTTEGGTQTQAGQRVLGQIVPYKGEYGISDNPESLAIYGYRKYFTDLRRNAVMRLSNDGLTEISAYGMQDYFRDQFALVSIPDQTLFITSNLATAVNAGDIEMDLVTSTFTSNSSNPQIAISPGMSLYFAVAGSSNFTRINGFVTKVSTFPGAKVYFSQPLPDLAATDVVRFEIPFEGKLLGGWDIHNKNYILSVQQTPTIFSGQTSTLNIPPASKYNTLSFDERINGWVSFLSFKPTEILSLRNNTFTLNTSDLYKHYDSNDHSIFYEVRSPSSITFVFNANPSTMKVFKTIEYEGSSGWQVDSFVSGLVGPTPQGTFTNDIANNVYSYDEGLYTNSVTGQPARAGFDRKENLYVANLVSNSSVAPGEVRFGADMTGIKGYFATVKISTDNSTNVSGAKELWAASTEYIKSY